MTLLGLLLRFNIMFYRARRELLDDWARTEIQVDEEPRAMLALQDQRERRGNQ